MSFPKRQSRFYRAAAAALVAATAVIVPATVSQSAPPIELSGTVFRDIDADGLRDVNEPPFDGAEITLINTSADTVAAGPITSDATGAYSFSPLSAGEYRVEITAPDNYWISPATADNAFTPSGIGGSADQTARSANFSIDTESVTKIDAAVRPRPEVSLGKFGPGVLDGSPDFNSKGDCATPVATPTPTGSPEWSDTTAPGQVPGEDCGSQNGIVRSQDSVVTIWSVTADNYEPGAADLEAVMFEQIIHPGVGADVDFASIPVSCLAPPSGTGGATPESSIVYDDPNPGDVKLTCNLGSFPEGAQESLTTFLQVSGESMNGATFTSEQRVYAVDSDGAVSAVPNVAPEIGPIEISAAPAFDLGKDPIGLLNYGIATRDMKHDDHLPSCDTDPAPCNVGPEKGRYGYFMISLASDQKTGTEALEQPFTIHDDFFATTDSPAAGTPYNFEYEVTECLRNTSGWSNAVHGSWVDNESNIWHGKSVLDSGDCTIDRSDPTDPTSDYDFVIDNADLSGRAFPDNRFGGADLSAGPFFSMMQRVRFFIPFRSIDLADGAVDGAGSISVTNCLDDFDPKSVSGVSNFGADTEPGFNRSAMPNGSGTNNCAGPTTYDMSTTGSFSKYNYGYIGTNGYPYMNSGNHHHSGAHTFEPGQTFPGIVWNSNNGTNDLFDPQTCDVFDNTTLRLTTADRVGSNGWKPPYLADGSFAYINNGYNWNVENDPADFVVEYASADFGSDDPIVDGFNPVTGRHEGNWSVARQWQCDDSAKVTHEGTTYELADPGAAADPDGDRWVTDPTQLPNGVDDVNMVRGRFRTDTIPLAASDRMMLVVPLEIRNEFNGGPHDSTLIPAGTVLPNFGAARWGNYRDGNWTARSYQPSPETTHIDGDRVTITRAQLRLEKHTLTPPTNIGTTGSTLAGNEIVWEIIPTLTSTLASPAPVSDLTIVDILPKEVSYNASCTAALPNGTPVGLVEPNQPAAGQTRLTWFLGDWTPNTPIPRRVICTDSDPLAPNGTAVVNTASVTAAGVAEDRYAQEDTHTIILEQAGSIQLSKKIDLSLDDLNDRQQYTLAWTSFTPSFAIDEPTVIDVFSYDDDTNDHHDGPGSLSERDPASNFHGDYYLLGAPVTSWTDGSTPGAGDPHATIGTWFYSADAPWTIEDNPDLNTSNWCEETDFGSAGCPADFASSTAIKFVSNYPLERDGNPRQGVKATYEMQAGDPSAVPDPAKANRPGDIYTNRFSLDTTSLEADQFLRSNSISSQIAEYSVGDFVFADADGNGAYDNTVDAPAPDGTVVALHDATDDTIVDTMTIDSTDLGAGRYLFTALGAGDYYVTIPASNFAATGPLSGWVTTTIPAGAGENDDENESVDQHGFSSGSPFSNGVRSKPLTLSANPPPPGGIPTGNEPLGDNTGSISDSTGDDFSNLTLDIGLIPPAGIQLEKQVCTQASAVDCRADDDAHWGEIATIGYTETAIWRITVTNTGGQNLSNVTVTDSVEGDCANLMGTLKAGETVSYICKTNDILAAMTNTAEVKAAPVTGGTIDDQDSAQISVANPLAGVDVNKTTNTADAAEAPGIYVTTGGAVRWTYEVTNSGNIPLTHVEVIDDMGTVDTTDDVRMTLSSTSPAGAHFVSGDTDGDKMLDLTETWIFQLDGVATRGQYENIAEVAGTPVVPGISDVTGQDSSNHYGLDDPAIKVEKATNPVNPATPTENEDADAAPGPYVGVDGEITWSYRVTTDGSNVPLSQIVVTDDAGTPLDASDDFTPTYQSGDDGDDILEPGEEWHFVATGRATEGQYVNTAVASGQRPTITAVDGGETTNTVLLTDDDVSHHFGATWGLEVEMLVNGHRTDDEPGLILNEGDPVTWTYELHNTGNTPVTDIVIVDDQGVVVTCPATTLAPGESMTCTSETVPAAADQSSNAGTVTAQPADNTLAPIIDPETGQPVEPFSIENSSSSFGLDGGYTFEMLVCDKRIDPTCDVNNPDAWVDQSAIPPGESVVWLVEVEVTGDMALENVGISSPSNPACNRTFDRIESGETVRYTCEGPPMGDNVSWVNSLTLDGELTCHIGSGGALTTTELHPSDCGRSTTASTSSIAVKQAEIGLDKEVDDDTPEVGDQVQFTLTVSNEGGEQATEVEIIDVMPDSLTYVGLVDGTTSALNQQVSFDASTNTLTWTIPVIEPGESLQLDYRTTVTEATSDENVATISRQEKFVVLGNGASRESFTSTWGPNATGPNTGTPSTLAFTGSTTSSLIVSALVLLVAGLGFILFGRRRRHAE